MKCPWLHTATFLCVSVVIGLAQDRDTLPVASTSAVNKKLERFLPLNTHRITGEQIRSFPFRGLQNYLSILPGVVLQNGNLHFRGGRAGEVGYYVDGFSVTNPFFNSNGVEIIPEAIEELDVHTGAFGVELGRANAGIVHTRMKSGPDSLSFSLNVLTDNVVKTGDEFLKTTSFGFRNLVGTLGGPLLPGFKFFVAAQYDYFDNRQQMFLEPFRYDSLISDQLGYWPQGTPLPGVIEFRRNFLDNNWNGNTMIQGNVTLDLDDFQIRFLESYASEKFPDGSSWPVALQNYYRQKRNMINENRTWFGGVTVTHRLNDDFSYDVGFSLYDRFSRKYDPEFGDHWMLYPDSIENAKKGYTGFLSRYTGPYPYSTIYAFRFEDPNAPNYQFSKDRQSAWAMTANLSAQLLENWLMRGGAEMQSWTMRRFNVSGISFLLQQLQYYTSNSSPVTISNEYQKRVLMIKGGIDNFGYNHYGNQVEDGYDAPRNPRFISLFFDNDVGDALISLHLGARYEVFDLRIPSFPVINLTDYGLYHGQDPFPLNGVVNEDSARIPSSKAFFLPRLSMGYSFSSDASFYVSYGYYTQMAPLNLLLVNSVLLSSRINPADRRPVYFSGVLPGYYAEPEQTSQYEVGMHYSLSNFASLDINTFYKSFRQQLQLGKIYDPEGKPSFVALVNHGEGIAKGVELTLALHHARTLDIIVHYALSDARGRTSDPFWNKRQVTDEILPPTPEYLIPFDFSQTHQGSVMASLRFHEDDGEILDGIELSSLLTFNSGRRYTQLEELRYLGAAGVWNVGVRQLLDVRSANPIESFNSSTTPWFFNLDLRASKVINFGYFKAEFYVNVLNALNTKSVINVYPTTGTPTDDGWFSTGYAQNYIDYAPLYEGFYRTINLQNRWAYMSATGNDIYGPPRQIRFGLRVEM